ncbi:MAG: hypothetical protein AAGA54_09310 [Myxococcota bacterium]
MSTSVSMWLGIAFLVLGITAVLLQAWLWNPKYWNEAEKKTYAPKPGLLVHRWVGIAFTVIYVVMMWEMVPRLWEYQVELPARTVIHATAAIVLGVLLFTKLIILWFFRHFEESMPQLGFGILICTVIISVLSIPFALRAEGVGVDAFDEQNVERVRRLLAKVEFRQEGVDVEEITSTDGLKRGRKVLVEDCVRCHDMRTILVRPRTASGWYKVVDRMTEKPSVFGEPTRPEDVPYVTAYLVAITPEIQESRKLEEEDAKRRNEVLAGLVRKAVGVPEAKPAPAAAMPAADAAPVGEGDAAPAPAPTPPPPPAEPAAKPVDDARGAELLDQYCVDCHELDEVTDYGGADRAGWTQVMADMVEEGAEMPEDAAADLITFLTAKYPKGS